MNGSTKRVLWIVVLTFVVFILMVFIAPVVVVVVVAMWPVCKGVRAAAAEAVAEAVAGGG